MEILKIEDVKQMTNEARKGVAVAKSIDSTIAHFNEIIEYFAKEGQSLATIPIDMINGMKNEYVATSVYNSLSEAGYGLTKRQDVVIVTW